MKGKPKSDANRRHNLHRLAIESLEGRQMMTVNMFVDAAKVLHIDGGKGNDTVQVDYLKQETELKVTYRTDGGKQRTQSFATKNIKAIEFQGGADNDTFTNNTKVACTAWGGAGNDALTGGGGNDHLYGEQDQDTIHGGSGVDKIYGGAGHDNLYGGDGIDHIYGGDGNDGLYGGGSKEKDRLDGGKGTDRYLTQNGDTIVDLNSDDAQLVFKDGSSTWSNKEIEVLDEALAKLHHQTGNTFLLKDSVLNAPLTFIKESVIGGDSNILGRNTEWSTPYQKQEVTTKWDWISLSYVEKYDFRTYYRLSDRTIQIKEWDESMNDENKTARHTIIHEIGHNWDSAKEGNSQWGVFERTNKVSKGSEFVSNYAKSDVEEDWAETFASYFFGTKAQKSAASEKVKIVDNFFASMA